MGQRIISINLNMYDDEDTFNNFKRDKENLLEKLTYINTYLEKVNIERNLHDLKSRRERLIERVINMHIKLQKWIDFNVPKRETNRKILSELN